jgi:acyl-coenzyme A synthetase/AMP-(fatty) acid ligase
MQSQKIAALQQQIVLLSRQVRAFAAAHKITRVALYHADSEEFLVRLMALATAGCDIVLPANGQPDNLVEAANESDGVWFDNTPSVIKHANFAKMPQSEGTPNASFAFPTCGELTLFTSGSSGKAKAITKSWQHINAELENLNRTFTVDDDTRFVATVSHQHIYGMLFKLLWPFKYGKTFDCEFIEFPEQLAAKVAIAPCVIITSPAFITRLVKDNVLTAHKHNIRAVFSSGGPLSDGDAITLYQQLGVGAWQVYGSTETGGIGYRQVINSTVTPWQVFKGIEISKVGQQLCVRSPYFADAQQLLDDTGEILTNGYFILKGRLDRTIKLAEKRINLDAIERALLTHQAIEQVKVILLNNGVREQLALVACLTEFGQNELKRAGKFEFNKLLKAHLAERFEAVCLPRKFRYVDAMPSNPQGKLAYVELEKLFD